MDKIAISYRVMYRELIVCGRHIQKLSIYLKRTYPNISDAQIEIVIGEVKRRFVSQFRRRWNNVRRIKTKFEEKYREW